ncbi:TrbI/VirB10 family protein (plasmid) [Robbsia andropogonis]|uniref:TrbI/VirB10 family protein n=1 Tax=Robbsia andropogonis TaxID=28092 RepID=UPI003D19A578
MDDKHTNKPRVSRKLASISMIVLATVLLGIVMIRSLLHVQTPAELAAQKRQDKEAAEKPGDPAEERDREQSQLQRAQRAADAARAASEAANRPQPAANSIAAPLPQQFAKPPAQDAAKPAEDSQWHAQSLAAYESQSSGGSTGSAGGGAVMDAVNSQMQRLQDAIAATTRNARSNNGQAGNDERTSTKDASSNTATGDLLHTASLSSALNHVLGDGGNVSSASVNSGNLPEGSKSVGPSNTKWLQSQDAGAGTQAVALHAVAAESPYTLQETGTIHVTILQGLNSDLPTEIRAMVTQDVYDTITGTHLLIPKGSMLAAKVNTDVARGQDRMMIAFTRLLLRGGASVNLGAMSGADAEGYAGIEANVNRHLFARFGAAFLIALVETAANSGSSDTTISIGSSVSSAGTTGLSQVTQAVLNSNINIQDTLTVKPGAEMTVVVTRDLVLPPQTTGIYQ